LKASLYRLIFFVILVFPFKESFSFSVNIYQDDTWLVETEKN
jgi:hypothetical protein